MCDYNILYTLKNNLCTGCGVCEDICPTRSIEIIKKNGDLRPRLIQESCLGEKCGRCMKVCPGIGCDFDSMPICYFENNDIKYDKYIGKYHSLHVGYSLDEDIRYHSASGGIVSQFLVYLLDKRLIDGAVVTGFSEIDHISPVSYIARTKDEILNAKSSKYCPVSMNGIGNQIASSEGKFIIVGLPCHIQGFRKRAQVDSRFRGKIFGYFSIYCSSTRTFNAQEFLLRKYNPQQQNISYFAYRDNGCLGNLSITGTNLNVSVPYSRYYGALRSFFKPYRCLSCIDHYGRLSDVSYGDIHVKPYSDDVIGTSSWIIRNSYFRRLFDQAVDDGYIYMADLDADLLNKSQKVMFLKRRQASAICEFCKLMGKKVAMTGVELDKPKIKDYLSILVCRCQQFIGRHKRLWWIIDDLYNGRVGNLVNK